jgi:VWFA-related protein
MKILTSSLLILALVTASTLPTLAQTPTNQQEQDEEKLVVGTNEVLLDAVVKDKKGHTVKDLKASDFEVYEDGVRQQVKSFRLVNRDEATTAPNNTTGTPSQSTQPIVTPRPGARLSTNRLSAVALVFDRLSPDARARAREAALSYIGNEVRPDDFIGVFGIDLSLKAIQSFTNNAQLIRAAIERATSHAPSSFTSSTEQLTNLSQTTTALQSQVDVNSGNLAGGGPTGSGQALAGQSGPSQSSIAAAGAAAADLQFAEMTERAVEGFERLERSQQGYATTEGLLAVVNAMGRLPGRKALILFSEGLAIPVQVVSHFRSVISAANRANVSIYAVDAAGLRALSSDADAGRAMTALGQKRTRIAGSPSDGTGGPMMRDLERNEDLLRLNPESGLGQLANETGGLLISNTNNPGPRLRQVDEDLHAYYLLTYTPQNQNFDGHFRQINLKINRPGVDVQARKGYYALNASYDTPVLDYEAPAVAILSGRSQPNAFDSRVAAFNFPEPGKNGLVPVMVEVPADSINFVANNEKKNYSTNFAVVVLIKDENQRVVRKLSNQYLLSGPLDKLEAARQGKVLFYRETQLEPGRFTVASVVYDATTGHASTNTASLVVTPADQSRLRMSSIVLIKNAERMPAVEQNTSNPFHFGEVVIYPYIDQPLSKAATKNLPFFVTVYPAPGASETTRLTLEILRGGHSLAQVPLKLPAPDQTGRIQFASTIPIDKLQPGDYELKLTARDAKDTVTRTEQFTIKP